MALLSGIYLLVTLAVILTFAVSLLLWALCCLKHIIPNSGNEPLIALAQNALRIARWTAFFAFLAFVILSFVTAGVEFIAYGGIRNPIIMFIYRALRWIASKMTLFAGKIFSNSQYGEI